MNSPTGRSGPTGRSSSDVAARVLRRFAPLSLVAALALSGGAHPQLSPPQSAHASMTRPWEHAIPSQDVPKGLSTLRASECGECHAAIYREWKATAHALAMQDRQFQAEWKKDNHLWLCLNCHTPLANQQERLVDGLVDGDFRKPVAHPNDHFDPMLRDEGITCAVCHVRDGAVVGPGPGGEAPHPVSRAGDALSQKLCESCHNVQGQLSETLICTFTTGDEWRANGMAAKNTGCIDCHMPPVLRPAADGASLRPGHKHTWPGAGIAKRSDLVEPLSESYRPGYDVEIEARRASGNRGQNEVVIDAAIANARAGHELPTGDPERYITIEIVLRDRSGQSVWRREERIGEVWEWFPVARQVSDNSLKPGERREFHYAVSLPGNGLDSLTVEVVARNHRMTVQNAQAMAVFGIYPLHVATVRRSIRVSEPRRR